MQESILKLPILLISLKLENNFFLSILISDIKGKVTFVGHEHLTFFVVIILNFHFYIIKIHLRH